MKSFIRIFILAGVPYGVGMGIVFTAMNGLRPGIFGGAVAGLLFGLAMAIITHIKANQARSSPPVLIDEVLIREGRAQYHAKPEGGSEFITNVHRVMGYLYLTEQRLIFQYLSKGRGNEISIPIHEISGVSGKKTFGIFSSKLTVERGETSEVFLMTDAVEWSEDITGCRQDYLNASPSDAARLFREAL